jgi:5-methylthioadenosine/S-adenosylhomocysteine deaminase
VSSVNSLQGRRLIRNATVVTLDPKLGDLTRGDVLIEGERIAEVGPNLSAAGAEVVEAGNLIAMPGFIDTHRHMWQGAVRGLFPDATLAEYFQKVLNTLGPVYRPEDAYVGDLVSAFSAIDAGITTILDWSHIQNTPEHTDAVIQALQDSGIRAVFGYGSPQLGGKPLEADHNHRYPGDIKRLRTQYFSTDNQLLTLALAADGPSFSTAQSAISEWQAAREVSARISVHLGISADTLEKMRVMDKGGWLKADTTYVHCTNMAEAVWKMIVDTGGTVSLASSVEMQMGLGTPAIQKALDNGLRPSLSVDVETSAPNDLFTQMRTVFALQRALANERILKGDKNPPKLITARDVLEFATFQGARANGLESKVGSLTPGKQADIILLRKDRINVVPLRDPIGAIVVGMDTGNVDSVFVAGKALKRHGQLIGVDLGALSARAAAAQQYVLSNAGMLSP